MVCQSTAKTAKIGPLENFPLYGSPGLILTGLEIWCIKNTTHSTPHEYTHNLDTLLLAGMPADNLNHFIVINAINRRSVLGGLL